jgi:hypothetical protein
MSRAPALFCLTLAACASPAVPATDLGGGAPCSGIDLQRSVENCGACGHACAPGEVCQAGACTLFCAGGTTRCGDACVDTDVDPMSCGGCGVRCADGQVCAMGVCSTVCPAGRTPCGAPAVCVDLESDRANCGSCGNPCGPGMICVNHQCVISCPPGLTACGGDGGLRCVDLTTDEKNCGSCGNVCGAGLVCTAGAGAGVAPASCAPQCGAGTTRCGSACVDTATNVAHCGGCNLPCAATQLCAGGQCYSGCVNVARSATPSTSGGGSDTAGYGPANLIDGVEQSCSSFTWIANDTTPTGAWAQLTWPQATRVGGIYLRTESQTAVCGTNGRNLASAKVQYWNGAGWVQIGTIGGSGGTHQLAFPTPVVTTQLRLYDVTATSYNTIIHEWHAYQVAGCSPPP